MRMGKINPLCLCETLKPHLFITILSYMTDSSRNFVVSKIQKLLLSLIATAMFTQRLIKNQLIFKIVHI